MDRQSSSIRLDARIALALVVAALGAAAVWAAGPGAPSVPATPGVVLLPDLRTKPPGELLVDGKRLRLSNTIVNPGVGPLEIFPETGVGSDCDGDGDDADDRFAFQRTYLDSDDPRSPGYFVRSQDPDSTTRSVGCMIFHPAHNHWHFDDFSFYVLRAESTGATVAQAKKVSFCVIDTDHAFPGLPGSPRFGYYGNAGCGADSVEGMSVGWGDTYGAFLPGQSLKVAGLPAANYCLMSRADPADRLIELDESNNTQRTRIFLDQPSQSVQVLAGKCQLP